MSTSYYIVEKDANRRGGWAFSSVPAEKLKQEEIADLYVENYKGRGPLLTDGGNYLWIYMKKDKTAIAGFERYGSNNVDELVEIAESVLCDENQQILSEDDDIVQEIFAEEFEESGEEE